MNVMISGLTAAGKTTHCKRLASELNLRYISATEALADLAGLDPKLASDPSFWVSHAGQAIADIRSNGNEIDVELDRRLCELAEEGVPSVFDTFGLPWFCRGPAVRIWLESSFESRLTKAVISHMDSTGKGREELHQVLGRKDSQTRNDLHQRYGIDIFCDREVFDLVTDISDFIADESFESAARSIERTHRILSEAVNAYFEVRL